MSERAEAIMILRCLKCAGAVPLAIGAEAGRVACPICRAERDADPGAVLDETGLVSKCGGCGDGCFYVQKDFSRMLGCAIFFGTILVSVVVAVVWQWIWWMVVLAAATLFDAVLYGLLPRVTVCYRCKAIYRGVPINPAHGPFDLATAEKFDADSPVMD